MFDRIVYTSLDFISTVSSKVSVWSWQKLWKCRDKGIGYKYFRGKNK